MLSGLKACIILLNHQYNLAVSYTLCLD